MGQGRCTFDSCLFWRYRLACSGGMNALMPKASRALLNSCRPSSDRASPKRGEAQNPRCTVRALLPRLVYPTTPVSGSGPSSSSGMDVDKVPASVNIVDVNQIQRTQSLNIADALQKYVPGIIAIEVTGNPFQPDVQFRGFVASPVAGTPQRPSVFHNR